MIRAWLKIWLNDWLQAWNRFWFLPSSADTLAIIRILVGSMLLYSHAVWTFDLEAFFGANSAIPASYRTMYEAGTGFAWSHFDWLNSFAWLWGSHFAALIVFFMFTIGLWTRVVGVLAWLFVVSYANRATGALFGLDQINAFLTLYLTISNCGELYSLDHFLTIRRGESKDRPTVANTIATRLIQLHICVVYLFAGLGKLQGLSWWNGEAIWYALASHEYQTLDVTWMADYMWLVNIITYVAVAWEVSYAFLVWPRLTRPMVLAMAVMVHLGIGCSMGMMTFGLIMIYGNIAFVPPDFARAMIRRIGGQGLWGLNRLQLRNG